MFTNQSGIIEFYEQTAVDKIKIIDSKAYDRLGKLWSYYEKIKRSSDNFSFFKGKPLEANMKATRSALIYSSRNLKKLYKATYLTTAKEIKKYNKEIELPELPEQEEGKEEVRIPIVCDSIMLQWTPIKFLLPAKNFREKGKATSRHTEGLIAKMLFKVAAYYATPENWDLKKLCFYLSNLKPDDGFQEVSAALSPLKKDLSLFKEVYSPIKFGKPPRGKDAKADAAAVFDDQIQESRKQQIVTLYWHQFIYLGIELFLFKYYLILIAHSPSIAASKYISQIFEPILFKALEIRLMFQASLEMEPQKRIHIEDLEKYKLIKKKEGEIGTQKVFKKEYESYNYNLSLLEKNALSFDKNIDIDDTQSWKNFLANSIFKTGKLATDDFASLSLEFELDEDEVEKRKKQQKDVRNYSLMQIINIIIKCNEHRQYANQEILAHFKEIVKSEQVVVQKRITKLKREADKQISLRKKKLAKLKALKQKEAIAVFTQDIAKFEEDVNKRCQYIAQTAKLQLMTQKKRIKHLIEEFNKENLELEAKPAQKIFNLSKEASDDPDFPQHFTSFVANSIQAEYNPEMESFYKNMFFIMKPSTQEKVSIIQALEKSGGEDSIKLTLDADETKTVTNSLEQLRKKINHMQNGIFKMKVVFGTIIVPIEDLISMSIDNQSLSILLSLKIQEPQKPMFNLKRDVIQSILVLNSIQNPMPKNNLLFSDRLKSGKPEQAVNSRLLNELIVKIGMEKS